MKTIKEIVGDRILRTNNCSKKCEYEEGMILLQKTKDFYMEMFEENEPGSSKYIQDMQDGFYWYSNDVMDAYKMIVYKRDGIYYREYY